VGGIGRVGVVAPEVGEWNEGLVRGLINNETREGGVDWLCGAAVCVRGLDEGTMLNPDSPKWLEAFTHRFLISHQSRISNEVCYIASYNSKFYLHFTRDPAMVQSGCQCTYSM
jgi:hypothetical protein